ncbi:PTS sugar transporter subunit IIB [Enterococcus hulanensis]|nr:PTS sugar transporter subunit IIB [Enterococcus hulanensis]
MIMEKKNILVVCGNGAATSTMVLQTLKEMFDEKGVRVELAQKKVQEVNELIKDDYYDMVVSTSGTDFVNPHNIPVFSGVPLLTGLGKEQMLDDVLAALK